jgi:hypothetical protein
MSLKNVKQGWTLAMRFQPVFHLSGARPRVDITLSHHPVTGRTLAEIKRNKGRGTQKAQRRNEKSAKQVKFFFALFVFPRLKLNAITSSGARATSGLRLE